MKRVVVTGLGLNTSIGNNVGETWKNLIAGKSGIKKIENFDTNDLPCKIAGFISHDPKDKNYLNLEDYFEKKEINRNDRFILYGLIAASMAIKDANIENLSEKSKLRTGITVGSGIGGLETIYNGSTTLNERGPKRISPFFIGTFA